MVQRARKWIQEAWGGPGCPGVGDLWPGWAAIAETQMRFGTPEAAVEVLRTALKNDDESTLRDLIGQEYAGRLLSKDQVAARADRQRLYQAIRREPLTLRKDTADRVVLVMGENAWPFFHPARPEWR